ncbi:MULTISPECIES: biotin/lipoyl-containing protein [Sphingobium]|uniref:biotin/lipoyl-containing protein n=1 Tax=Sphingobium sp. MI1205 TaxID=407020 RepID=UPI00077049F5|nr:lipoyl domain-containing protein [Sphingobium sp. MI1205]AMK19982.1 putative acyltransferase [Sphingobium sp. MI1205]
MTEDILLPRFGMNMTEATIVRWLKRPGETFACGEPLYEIETDKVTSVVEATFDGTLLSIEVEEGDDAEVAQCIARASHR